MPNGFGTPGARLTRENRLARMLMAQEQAAPPIQSHTQGLASLLRQGLAGFAQGQDVSKLQAAQQAMATPLGQQPPPMPVGMQGPAQAPVDPYADRQRRLSELLQSGNEYAGQGLQQVSQQGEAYQLGQQQREEDYRRQLELAKLKLGGGGPFRGTGMEAQYQNILATGDPSSREYAAAYAQMSAPKVMIDPASGVQTRITPDVSMYQAPTFGSQGAQPEPSAQPTAAGQPTIEQTPGKVSRPMTQDQSNAAVFADRMRSVEPILSDPSLIAAATDIEQKVKANVPGIANYLVSPEYRQYDQARRDFINAVLRRESGAAIAESEFENANMQYFPQPGDDPKTLEQKARNRNTALAGITRAAGPSYNPAPAPGATPPPSLNITTPASQISATGGWSMKRK